MRFHLALAAFALLLVTPAAVAQGDDSPADFVVTFHADGTTSLDAPPGLILIDVEETGSRYEWRIVLTDNYTIGEFREEGAFSVDRVRQVVPMLFIDDDMPLCEANKTRGACDYPLFEWVPREDLRTIEAPVRVYNATGEPGSWRFRIGLPGPQTLGQETPIHATLAVARDVEPPAYTLGSITNLTHVDFYRETQTEELAIADLQVRKEGATEWVQNPTPIYHFLQRFPVQGLDAATRYETQVVFTDWAGNSVTSPIESFATPPAPVVPKPSVTPLSPAPNATRVEKEGVVLEARVDDGGAPLTDIRLFFDLTEVRENLVFEDGVVRYAPGSLEDGLHTVSVEATNAEGGKASARWTFTVGEPVTERAGTPGAPVALALALVAAVALALRRR